MTVMSLMLNPIKWAFIVDGPQPNSEARRSIPFPPPPPTARVETTAMAGLRRVLLHLRKYPVPSNNGGYAVFVSSTPPLLRLRYLLGSVCGLSSDSSGWLKIDLSNEESKRQIINRMLYRSKQRGFLELDLVLGNWVEEHIRAMDEADIRALADVLDLENPDLWKWLTGQEKPPEAVECNPVFSAVRSKVMKNLDSHSSPSTRANPGQPWVRGWDDKRGTEGPNYGNQ